MDGHFEGSSTEEQALTQHLRSLVTIDMLPDVALLTIFDFYVDEEQIEVWHTLVHVCRKWRIIVFDSLRRLNLRIHCKASTPVREMLDIWPLLPIVVWASGFAMLDMAHMGNIFAALKHNDRVHQLELSIRGSQLENILPAMQRPFPELTHLRLQPIAETVSVIPASFLGGSAPSLRTLILGFFPFPELPNLLLSATLLVRLNIFGIPDSVNISPEAMVNVLSVLTRLESLAIGFNFPQSPPVRKSQHPQTRTPLPVLTELQFEGVNEYLEDLVAQIDTPLLDTLKITFFYDRLIFDTLQLTHFISRTPRFKTHDEAHFLFSERGVWITLPQTFGGGLKLGISQWRGLSKIQLSSLAQVWSSSFPQALPAVERLYAREDGLGQKSSRSYQGSSRWPELFRPFTAVKGLYISRKIAWRIGPALRELVREGVTEAFPALENIFLEDTYTSGRVLEAIEQFVAARQLTVSRWDGK